MKSKIQNEIDSKENISNFEKNKKGLKIVKFVIFNRVYLQPEQENSIFKFKSTAWGLFIRNVIQRIRIIIRFINKLDSA